MSIQSKDAVDQSLFVSVDLDFKNSNQVNFSFIPAVQHEVRQFISNMVPMLLNKYSDQNIATYFQAEAVLRGQNCAWDSTTQTVINSDEAYLQSFQEFEEDFLADKYDISSVQLVSEDNQDIAYRKVQNNFQGTEIDSVGTIKTAPKTFSIPQTQLLMNLLEVCIQKILH